MPLVCTISLSHEIKQKKCTRRGFNPNVGHFSGPENIFSLFLLSPKGGCSNPKSFAENITIP